MLIVLFMGLAASLVLCALGLPLLAEKVPPNRFYGLPTSGHRSLWYKTNLFFGRRLILSGGVLAGATLALYSVPGLSVRIYAFACCTTMLLSLVASVIQTLRRRNRNEEAHSPEGTSVFDGSE